MRLPVLLIALVATVSHAEDLSRRALARNRTNGDGSNVAFSFLPDGPAMGDLAAGVMPASAVGNSLSFTRGSTTSCINASSVLVELNVNEPCVESNGVLFEPASTNLLLRSSDLGTTWTPGAGTAVTVNQRAFIDGTASMDLVTKTSDATAVVYQPISVASAGPFTASGWVAATSGTSNQSFSFGCAGPPAGANCTCFSEDGTACTAAVSGNSCNGYMLATTTPARFTLTVTCPANPGTLYFGVTPGRINTDSTGTGHFGGMQVEANAVASSYIPTIGTQVTRAATTASVANPLTGSAFCVAATLTPRATGLTWAGAAIPYSLGQGGVANSAYSTVNASGVLQANVTDNAGDFKVQTGPNLGTTAHTTKLCVTGAGAITQYVDSVAQASSISGTGTGIVTTQPATFFVGYSGASSHFRGYLKAVCLDANPASGGCP